MAGRTFFPHDVEHGGPRRLVPGGRDDTQWLVHHEVSVPGHRPHFSAVDGDAVDIRVDQPPRGGNSFSVDAHHAGSDQLIGGATARNAGSCEEAIQAFLVRARSLDVALVSSRGVGR